jgi:hypothetical protein
VRAILEKRVFARDEVAVEHDEVYVRLGIENGLDDPDRVDVLLWAPSIPGIFIREMGSSSVE